MKVSLELSNELTANIKAYDRKRLGLFKETTGGNMDIKGASVELSEVKKKKMSKGETHYWTLGKK